MDKLRIFLPQYLQNYKKYCNFVDGLGIAYRRKWIYQLSKF